ncbi:MAG TPA: 2-oxoglutarate dehydrogenase complex dihydrolipoyllysine-residue succinyltransferase [Sphingomicrobium sp.]|nr:2-oxoglutarate dehydrogenase complex dihydrolipoyllysine-residue succinyltransferase [Sphingomicrobium sp.]
MATDVEVPALGESITEGTLAQWLKKPGEAVAADEPIASLETDKVSVEVPSPVAGVLTEQLVGEGDTVAVGAIIARIDDKASASAPSQPAPTQNTAAFTTNPAGAGETPLLRGDEHAPEPAMANGETGTEEDHVTTLSPAVRRAVLEYHVDPTRIRGTGKDGRLTKDDVIAAAQAQSRAAPEAKAPSAQPVTGAPPATVSPSKPTFATGDRREERVKMTRLRQTIARRLKEAQNSAAMLTTFNDVDMSAVIEARARYKDLFEKKHGIRLGFMGFFVKACALAAKDVPSVNASIEGDEIVYRDYLDVSVAVSAPKGLVVPVVRDADRMSFADIEKTIADFGKRAKDGTLTVDEMQGGTFTISNGGVFGSLLSTPIINPPQSAVLGMHRIEERPVVKDGQIVARPMMYLALSYDHRLIDGREAVTFLVRVKEAIEDPTRLLIDL